jgi:hypothetical protein
VLRHRVTSLTATAGTPLSSPGIRCRSGTTQVYRGGMGEDATAQEFTRTDLTRHREKIRGNQLEAQGATDNNPVRTWE